MNETVSLGHMHSRIFIDTGTFPTWWKWCDEIDRFMTHRMIDCQTMRVESDTWRKVDWISAVFSIAQHGIAARTELQANLMLSACFQNDFNQLARITGGHTAV